MTASGQQRPITTVDDESGLPPTADELLRTAKDEKGQVRHFALQKISSVSALAP